jgi:hypothetical protein
MKFSNIFWGVILIFIGVLFILQNLNVIHFNWIHLWRLWPVILVLWGVSILPAHSLIKVFLTLVVLGGTVYFMVDQTVIWDDPANFKIEKWDDWEFDESTPVSQSFSIPYDDSVSSAMLELDLAAGAFYIDDMTDNLIDFNKKGNKVKYAYNVKRTDERAVISIEREDSRVVTGKSKHRVTLNLNTEPLWDLNLDVGAAALEFDLSDFKVKNLDIDGGAAALEIILGDKHNDSYVNIDAGASSIELSIPESSGCDLKISSVLSGKSINGFEKLEHGHYRTDNFAEAENKIFIEVDAAVSSYEINRY